MDTPWILALIVFVGIFLMFVIISLLSDLLIIGTVLGCTAAAYFIPEWYPLFYEFIADTQIPVYLGLAAPVDNAPIEQATIYTLTGLLIFFGTLVCIPALPFSATYRQILGANKIGKRDEAFVKALVKAEMDEFEQPKHKPQQATRKPDPRPERPADFNDEPLLDVEEKTDSPQLEPKQA